ncbi:carboxypeptidase regulatory-like domain-containing protein [Candidatus Sumerlaeota bacterium]|nr:carboxypeptidase regulatory-like domain-containing protein [Candidatus Sumerlaeota bacterium]
MTVDRRRLNWLAAVMAVVCSGLPGAGWSQTGAVPPLQPDNLAVTGRLIDAETGAPLASSDLNQATQNSITSARIFIQCKPPSQNFNAILGALDENGAFNLDTKIQNPDHVSLLILDIPGRVQLRLDASTLKPALHDGTIDFGDIRLKRLLTLELRLVDASTSQPIEIQDIVGIQCSMRSDRGGYISTQAFTTGQGRLLLETRSEDQPGELTVSCGGYESAEINEFPEPINGQINLGDLPLKPQNRIRFRLLTGEPPRPFVIASQGTMSVISGFRNEEGTFDFRETPLSRITQDGVYEAAPLEKETILIRIVAAGFKETRILQIPQAQDGVTDLGDIMMNPARRIIGRIMAADGAQYPAPRSLNEDAVKLYDEEDNPLPLTYRVQLQRSSLYINEVPEQAKTLELIAQGFLPQWIELPEPGAGEVINLPSIELKRGCIVRGKAESPRGEPARNAIVFIAGAENLQHAVSSDAQGNFELSGFKPGPARVVASVERAEGNSWIPADRDNLNITNQEFEIEPGVTTLNLMFQP